VRFSSCSVFPFVIIFNQSSTAQAVSEGGRCRDHPFNRTAYLNKSLTCRVCILICINHPRCSVIVAYQCAVLTARSRPHILHALYWVASVSMKSIAMNEVASPSAAATNASDNAIHPRMFRSRFEQIIRELGSVGSRWLPMRREWRVAYEAVVRRREGGTLGFAGAIKGFAPWAPPRAWLGESPINIKSVIVPISFCIFRSSYVIRDTILSICSATDVANPSKLV
jgi:hypothetical protein